jgi:hypothetical protein
MGDDLETRLDALETRVKQLEETVANPVQTAPHSGKQQSVKEFLLSATPKTAADKTLLLAYYAEYSIGLAPFSANELEGLFRQAKEKPPANINDMVNKNVGKGFLMEGGAKNNKKTWELTNSGEGYVAHLLSRAGE